MTDPADLHTLLAKPCALAGVLAVLVATTDGLLVADAQAPSTLDLHADVIAAQGAETVKLMGMFGAVFGDDHAPRTVTVEYGDHLLHVLVLRKDALLILYAEPVANLGMVRLVLNSIRPGVEESLP